MAKEKFPALEDGASSTAQERYHASYHLHALLLHKVQLDRFLMWHHLPLRLPTVTWLEELQSPAQLYILQPQDSLFLPVPNEPSTLLWYVSVCAPMFMYVSVCKFVYGYYVYVHMHV